MIEADGSYGEGGGQILRSALSLALVTRQAFRIDRLRVARNPPGLRPQHLQAVRAAEAIGQASVEGAELGSQRLVFRPGELRPGNYRFDIGTAGSAPLILQALSVPLALAGSQSQLSVGGGTHVPWSPCFHYLAGPWLELVRRIGLHLELSMLRPGFYPKGGGEITARIGPASSLRPLNLSDRGRLQAIEGLSAVANLPDHILERQREQALRRLEEAGLRAIIARERWSALSPGTLLLLNARFEHVEACFFALGERGKPAEQVADEAVDALLAFLDSDAAVEMHLADQLLLPLSLAQGPSVLRTQRVTPHLITNAWLIQRFLPVRIDIGGENGEPADIRIRPTDQQTQP
jgi:RNA 3'-terminal phosphate cyclase (ATP)